MKKPTLQNVLSEYREWERTSGCRNYNALVDLFGVKEDFRNQGKLFIRVCAVDGLYNTNVRYKNELVAHYLQVKPWELRDSKILNDPSIVTRLAAVPISNERIINYTSFASKFVHVLSKGESPIYDSYAWWGLVYYLNDTMNKPRMTPKDYAEFLIYHKRFTKTFGLKEATNIMIDKFLWNMVNKAIQSERSRGRSHKEARTLVKNMCFNRSSRNFL